MLPGTNAEGRVAGVEDSGGWLLSRTNAEGSVAGVEDSLSSSLSSELHFLSLGASLQKFVLDINGLES